MLTANLTKFIIKYPIAKDAFFLKLKEQNIIDESKIYSLEETNSFVGQISHNRIQLKKAYRDNNGSKIVIEIETIIREENEHLILESKMNSRRIKNKELESLNSMLQIFMIGLSVVFTCFFIYETIYKDFRYSIILISCIVGFLFAKLMIFTAGERGIAAVKVEIQKEYELAYLKANQKEQLRK